jgi:hypothetical protein
MIIQQTNIGLARYMACTRVKSKQFLEWKIWNKKKAWNKQMQKKKRKVIFKWAFKKREGYLLTGVIRLRTVTSETGL